MNKLSTLPTALSVWVAKIPHLAFVLVLAIVTWGPDVLPVLKGTPWAVYAPDIAKVIAFCVGLLALAKQLNPNSDAAKRVDDAILAKAKKATDPSDDTKPAVPTPKA